MTEQLSRLEQLGTLFTAMIAVVLTGGCDLAYGDSAAPAAPVPIAAPTALIPIAEEFAHRPPYGIYSRVAKRLGISAQYTTRVALGKEVNERVALALIQELRNPPEPARAATYAGTILENCPVRYGAYASIARSLGCTTGHVRDVAVGIRKSARVMRALEDFAKAATN